jgi:hypothetical protein
MATEIILEPIIDDNANVNETVEPSPVDDEAESPPEPIVEAVEEVPVKRPRGRPKGKAAAKVVPPPKPKTVPKAPKLERAVTTRRKPEPEYSDSSTSEEDMVGRLIEDDMETQILQFLSARKRDQESKRRNLWQNLASSRLRR